MKTRHCLVALTIAALPFSALAAGENNIGSCGWGSKVFAGQSGIAPQVLGATTNGTFGNQTFAITSGTSGCTQDGAVSTTWQTAAFIDGNKEKLARDLSRGNGESLDSLAQLLGVEEQDKARFVQATRDNIDRIFPTADASTDDIRAGLRAVLGSDAKLGAYTARI
ncbi:MAG: DUF3015 domain-containing protein [Burkholderiales bacterium]|nr:DUF3015 domain-containing protein [Burkholderiales bacterium]